ncbi:hypothetical protein [Mycobacterium sp.]|uniref:hypothetical protein n=1 Tax=Mycobacterium sp. TaxID=1785 RepID=UPI001219659F|nr:hypothetical protein [Mycobacterium sp.]TAM71806.1 MAG: hypothetical protein EPN51_05590 [Mycobacterium sp.]
MVGDPPSGFSQGPAPAPQSPAGNWPPHYVEQPASRSRPWLAIAVAATAAVAVTALFVASTRKTDSHSSVTTTTVPTHTHAETAAAQQQLCDTYKLAARAVQVDTNGSDKALARTATTNAAVMLENASADPALDAQHRDPARTLATAYLTATAKATNGVAADAEWRAALDDVIAKDAAMKQVCGGG